MGTLIPLLAMFFIPAIVVLLADYGRMNPNRFIGVYVLAVAAELFAAFMYADLMMALLALAAGVTGAVICIILMGLLGGRFGQSSYLVVGAAIGLFPWFVSPTASAIYGILVAISIGASLILTNLRRKSIKGVKEKTPRLAMGGVIAVAAAGVVLSVI